MQRQIDFTFWLLYKGVAYCIIAQTKCLIFIYKGGGCVSSLRLNQIQVHASSYEAVLSSINVSIRTQNKTQLYLPGAHSFGHENPIKLPSLNRLANNFFSFFNDSDDNHQVCKMFKKTVWRSVWLSSLSTWSIIQDDKSVKDAKNTSEQVLDQYCNEARTNCTWGCIDLGLIGII